MKLNPTLRGLSSLSLIALCILITCSANAQTGVSDDRSSLPDGSGSLGGVGENVSINPSMGQMTWSIPIEVPKGYPGATPELSLGYSSGGATSALGVGWDMSVPFIERMTSRGLPEYTTDDMFAADGADQLVRVDTGSPMIYRSRFEGGFVRYSWHAAGSGAQGWWKAEYPDGTVACFGATCDGTLVNTARFEGVSGTFRYQIVERLTPSDDAIRYAYQRFGNVPLLTRITWGYTSPSTPLFSIELSWEDREDHISDGRSGVNELLTQRLSAIEVRVDGQTRTRYVMTWEDYASSGGVSRLIGVREYGAEGGLDPVQFGFTYSRGLGGLCQSGECEGPRMVSMGTIAANIMNGDATLIDINGDALPDIVDTSQAGPHRFFINRLDADGGHGFLPAASSAVGTRSQFQLSEAAVEVLDIDGDGFTDMVSTANGLALRNLGGGDWESVMTLGSGDLPSFEGDFDTQDNDLRTIRFFDYDNDKRIDVLRSEGSGQDNATTIYRNDPAGGFSLVNGVESLESGFEADRLDLADMNGDGLLDPVELLASGRLRYRLNLGRGRWDDWITITNLPFMDADIPNVEIEDINGDGLADLILVLNGQVRYALNRNASRFDASVTLTSSEVDGTLPPREQDTTVLYADMNGNGSTDIVWIQGSGAVNYLELFPVRPNFLMQIVNGIGAITDVEYTTSVLEAARDREAGAPWAHAVPFPMVVVKRVDDWDRLTNVHDVTEYYYRDGYYDGVEKSFRGYGETRYGSDGDIHKEDSWQLTRYDLGVDDPYRAGRSLYDRIEGEGGRVLKESMNTWSDCPVADIPSTGLDFPIRHVCLTRIEEVIQEGRPEDEWARVRSENTWDGYGNVTLAAEHGVTSIGGGACAPCQGDAGEFGAPCGAQCLGDERYSERSFISPQRTNGRWILNAIAWQRSYGRPDAEDYRETVVYYDGEPFVGLPLGELTTGFVSRVAARHSTTPGDMVLVEAFARDAHGNVTEMRSPQGEGQSRAEYTWDADGLLTVRSDLAVTSLDEEPYMLRQEVRYDALWRMPSQVSTWVVVKDGAPMTPPRYTSTVYDEFGRESATLLPDDANDAPSTELEYDIGPTMTRIIERGRSVRGGPQDIEVVRCLDGQGRTFQTRRRVSEGRWLVTGLAHYAADDQPLRTWGPFEDSSGDCDMTPPDVDYNDYYYDPLNRQRQVVRFDARGAATTRWTMGPFEVAEYDVLDNDPENPAFETPRFEYVNGLGKVTRIQWHRTEGEPLEYTLGYDHHGQLTRITDPEGNDKTQRFNLRGSVIEVNDPDRGTIRFAWSDAGELEATTDGRGFTRHTRRDTLGRPLEAWTDNDPEGTRMRWYYDTPRACPLELCTNTGGKLVEAHYPLGEREGIDWYGYDLRGNFTATRRAFGTRTFEVRYERDNAERLVRALYPDGSEVRYTYDAADRLTALPGFVDSISYNERGVQDVVRLANGVASRWLYDPVLKPAGFDIDGPGNTTLAAYRYTWDRAGNLLSVTDEAVTGDNASATARYTYDTLGRLTGAHLDPGIGAHDELLTYGYDDLDNLITKRSTREGSPEHVGDLRYGEGAGPRAVTTAGGLTLDYDDAGNMTRRGQHTLRWDATGRLSSISQGEQLLSRAFYGPDDSRVIEETIEGDTWYVGDDFEVTDGITSLYVAAGPPVARRRSAAMQALFLSDVAPATEDDGALTPEPDGVINAADARVAWVHLNGEATLGDDAEVDDPRTLLRGSARRMLLDNPEQGDTLYLHKDLRGSTVALTDDQGALVERTTYYPWGLERSGGDLDPYSYANRKADPSTGLLAFGARHYDPTLGRWASPDASFSVTEPGNLQLRVEDFGVYSFALNNPSTFSDTNGNFAVDIALAIVSVLVENGPRIGGAITGAVTNGFAGYRQAKAELASGANPETAWTPTQYAALNAGVGAVSGFFSPESALGDGLTAVVGVELEELIVDDAPYEDSASGDARPKVNSEHKNKNLLKRRLAFKAIGIGLAVAGFLLSTFTPLAVVSLSVALVFAVVGIVDAIRAYQGKTTINHAWNKFKNAVVGFFKPGKDKTASTTPPTEDTSTEVATTESAQATDSPEPVEAMKAKNPKMRTLKTKGKGSRGKGSLTRKPNQRRPRANTRATP